MHTATINNNGMKPKKNNINHQLKINTLKGIITFGRN